ncbi:hypothetical protein NDI44_08580 [Trichocoleus sp. DQ-A3]|uniref:KGK domain-containing protein n=1 Tax=Cyanophyceae TaxID=3028117 RepID=UPI00168A15FE|nr:KGK domain-containing protein [Coleofasciculus sp. FACHB-125]MBD1899246.1 hypothetical protein [Coleofasciculus sp. FACHB-125]
MDIEDLDLSDEDVVVVSATRLGGIQKYGDLAKNLGTTLSNAGLTQWFKEGVQIEYLRTSGGGWKKGTLRLYLNFVPEEEDDPNSLDSFRRELETDQ